MNESDRKLVIAIGAAARTCAMYRELLEVARRYGNADETDRLTGSLAAAERILVELIDQALADGTAGQQTTAPAGPGHAPSAAQQADVPGGVGAEGPQEDPAVGDRPASGGTAGRGTADRDPGGQDAGGPSSGDPDVQGEDPGDGGHSA